MEILSSQAHSANCDQNTGPKALMFLKLWKESFRLCWFFSPLIRCCTSVEGVNDEEGCLFLLLENGQALLTWLSGESPWQEASRAINPEGWGSVENGQPSQFSARLPFAFYFRFHPFCVYACNCYSDDLILSCNSIFQLNWCCSSLKLFLPSAR